MKTTALTCWVFAAAFILAFAFVAVAQEAGIIEEVRGNAYWKKDARSARVKLHSRRDKGRLLRAGERVRCDPKSELRLRLYERDLSVPCSPTWFPIPYVQADKNHPARLVLIEYGRRGGGERGDASIYSPANRASVNPATFEIRWITNLGPVKSLLIKEASPSGRDIFHQNVVDGMSGHISSEGARQALVKYREERGHGPLLIILSDSRRRDLAGVRFFLITERTERDLDQELRSWKNEPEGMWRHLGMAHAFAVRQMFTEAAEEYEAALRYAPDSTGLLRRTIAAHQQTGNSPREKELRIHLARKTKGHSRGSGWRR
jgi:hypothetical protein